MYKFTQNWNFSHHPLAPMRIESRVKFRRKNSVAAISLVWDLGDSANFDFAIILLLLFL